MSWLRKVLNNIRNRRFFWILKHANYCDVYNALCNLKWLSKDQKNQLFSRFLEIDVRSMYGSDYYNYKQCVYFAIRDFSWLIEQQRDNGLRRYFDLGVGELEIVRAVRELLWLNQEQKIRCDEKAREVYVPSFGGSYGDSSGETNTKSSSSHNPFASYPFGIPPID